MQINNYNIKDFRGPYVPIKNILAIIVEILASIIIISMIFVLVDVEGSDLLDYIIYIVTTISITFVFGVLPLILAIKVTIANSKFKKYMNIILNNRNYSIDYLATVTKTEPFKVRADLENLIKRKYLRNAYIDYKNNQIIIDGLLMGLIIFIIPQLIITTIRLFNYL